MKLSIFLLSGLTCLSFATDSPSSKVPPNGLEASDWSSIRATYEVGRHAVYRQENGTLAARNPGQQWNTVFDGKGFTVTPDQGGWIWGLELTGYGARTLLSDSSSITHEGGKITCQRDDNLTEWFINDTRGLEQGWTFLKRPERLDQSEPIRLQLSSRGKLRSSVSPDGSAVSFHHETGGTALTYGGLKAWDADGKNLLVRFEPANEKRIHIIVDDESARYPVTIDPIAQQAYLKVDHPWYDDKFGASIAVSGNTLVVGAPYQDSRRWPIGIYPNVISFSGYGAAYVFTRNETSWMLHQILKAPSGNSTSGDFGSSVAFDGDTIIVGSPSEKVPPQPMRFGGFHPATYGAAYVYQREGLYWTPQARLESSNPTRNESFGCSVAIFGDTAVVGARDESTAVSQSGGAFVFKRGSNTWARQALLKADTPVSGGGFGGSLAISGSTIITGASGASGPAGTNLVSVGIAYVFTSSGTNWIQESKLQLPVAVANEGFGYSVGIFGNTAVVGAPSWMSPSRSGSAHVFERVEKSWTLQQQLTASNPGTGDGFGMCVAISGSTIVVGAPWEDGSSTGVNGFSNDNAASAGAAYVYVNTGATWRHQSYLKASNAGAEDKFGHAVAVSANLVAVGAPYEDGSNRGVNSMPDEIFQDSGASYIFNGFGPQAFKPEIEVEESEEVITNGETRHFDQVLVAGSATMTFTIRNRGSDPLVLLGKPVITVTGQNAELFKVTSYPAATVGVAGSTSFAVKFTADGAGSRAAVLSIPSNDPDATPFVIRLEGSGITNSPLEIAQFAYLKASNTDAGDYFGNCVAVSGNTVVVGSPYESSSAKGTNGAQADNSSDASGAVYVFVKTDNAWTQQAYLKADNTSTFHTFGTSVAISGDTIAVSAPFQGKLADANGDSTGNYGAVFIFVRQAGNWTQQARVMANNTQDIAGYEDKFGAEMNSVALSGNTLVVGARWESSSAKGVNGNGNNEDSFRSGAAYVFVRSASAWSQQAYLKASNTDEGDEFGHSVGISGNTLVVGAPLEEGGSAGAGGNQADNSLFGSGAAYVFTRIGSSWSQQAYLKASNPGFEANFGGAVAVSGDVVVVGAPLEKSWSRGVNSVPNESAPQAGAAYIFARSGSTWAQQAYLKASNSDTGDAFGISVAASPNLVVVGAWGESSGAGIGAINPQDNNATLSGAAYAFQRSGTKWTQRVFLKAGNRGPKDGFGSAVAVSGTTLVIGAYFEDSQTRGVNTKSDEGANDSGAAYIFDSLAIDKPEIVVQQPPGSSLTDAKTRKSFGTVKVGRSGTAKVFTIKNDGSANLAGLSAKVTGHSRKEFVVTQPALKTLAPGTTTKFQITFKPATKGTRGATLKILSNDKDESPFEIPLSGMGAK